MRSGQIYFCLAVAFCSIFWQMYASFSYFCGLKMNYLVHHKFYLVPIVNNLRLEVNKVEKHIRHHKKKNCYQRKTYRLEIRFH